MSHPAVNDNTEKESRLGNLPQAAAAELRPADRDRPMGIVFGDARAAGCFEDRLGMLATLHGAGFTIRRGLLERRTILVMAAGATPQVGHSVEAFIAGHRPRWMIASGLAHGLDEQLRRGDVLLADQIVESAGNQLEIAPQSELSRLVHSARRHQGRLLSCDLLLRLPEEKRDLGHRFGALAAARSAFEVGEVCRREKVPFLAVHAVADGMNDRLAADVTHWAARPSLVQRLGALAGAIVHRPGSAKEMWNHYESSVAAAATLADALTEVIRLLA